MIQDLSDSFLQSADVSGRVFVITGAGSGIGLGCAKLLAERQATVVCLDIQGAEAAAESIGAVQGQALAMTLDVSDRSAVNAAAAETLSRFGRIDGWVNSAGVMLDGPVAGLTEATLDKVLGVNLKGTLWGCQAAAAAMRERGSGSIVNLSSGAADTVAPNTAAYSMSKGGVVQLTHVLAMELAAEGIRVNAIAPGVVLTGITERHYTRPDGSIDPERQAETLKRMAAFTPLQRIGTPQDIAFAAYYLLSDLSSFMTGQILRPNGGSVMR